MGKRRKLIIPSFEKFVNENFTDFEVETSVALSTATFEDVLTKMEESFTQKEKSAFKKKYN